MRRVADHIAELRRLAGAMDDLLCTLQQEHARVYAAAAALQSAAEGARREIRRLVAPALDGDAPAAVLGNVAVAQVADRPRGPVLGLRRLVPDALLVDDVAARAEAEGVPDALGRGR
jgi:hypothetical protein